MNLVLYETVSWESIAFGQCTIVHCKIPMRPNKKFSSPQSMHLSGSLSIIIKWIFGVKMDIPCEFYYLALIQQTLGFISFFQHEMF